MLYSKSTGGFYSREIHGDNIPSDSVEITDDQHAALLDAQSAGMVIQPDKDGNPVALPPVPLPMSAVIDNAKKQVRLMRSDVFYTLAGMQSEALAKGDTATATDIVGIQAALKALPEIDLSACKTADDVDAAFMAAWQAIVATAPASVVKAFQAAVA